MKVAHPIGTPSKNATAAQAVQYYGERELAEHAAFIISRTYKNPPGWAKTLAPRHDTYRHHG